ncbi:MULTISPECIES: methyltransferase domain-containing protein [Delftia]|uniref:Methyltransferase domain-containing protein n=1 Tax=Delftia lacustris TaxID=558537 RepID=A0A7T2YRB7_9BURK|nr:MULTISPECIES: methyltransferase domain-containing protein [Delftia]EPD46115.1 hypothetical protein HMPREF9702_00134 [Delftia acidovorans CCUG 15835]QPS80713.1 methyltransferase domain-containing protein [Delftia lacustris]
MISQLQLALPESLDSRSQMLWDALAVRLDIEWVISRSSGEYIRIGDGHHWLIIPRSLERGARLQRLRHNGYEYELLAVRMPAVRLEGSSFLLDTDIITPLQRMAALMLEEGLYPRAVDGTLSGASYIEHQMDAGMLSVDYIGELAALIIHVLRRPLPHAWHSIAPHAPYAVVTTFDCDGFFPGQPDALRRLLDAHEVVRPTLFVMAPGEADLSIYDPRYNPADPELRSLYEISEVGLHSSYRAYHDGMRIATQKAKLEDAIGRSVFGHRSHYLRFGFPYTWGYVAQAGFSYDMTMGFYDVPGFRQGGAQPIPMADPGGRGRLLWSWGVGLMDQHLFMPGSPLVWNDGAGKKNIKELLQRLRSTGGTLVLDWHVHGIDSAQFPHHQAALEWLLREARNDGAWIGGAGSLLEQYQKRASTQRLVDKVSMRTVEDACHKLQVTDKSMHTAHYVHGAGAAALTSVDYIDAGAYSFLAALPNDANRVVDVGCGSGWISHRVPPLRQVMGVDIDEGITRRISRRGVVGFLPHLPLEDGQADLVLCTDVLEHLNAQEVMDAGIEFDRISTRYAYLQTPCRERLQDSERRCDGCGERWHASHHLASHDAASLSRVMPEGWRTQSVTYTGDARLVDSSMRNRAGVLLGEHPMQYQQFTCLACGQVNEPQVSDPTPLLAEAQSKLRLPLPGYSEVAVLSARNELPQSWEDSQPVIVSKEGGVFLLPRPHQGSSHAIDFKAPVEEVASIAGSYQVPCVVVQDGILKRGASGSELVTSGLSEGATLFMMFPDQHAAGERAVLRGQVISAGSAELVFQAFNWANESCGSVQAIATGGFQLELEFERPAYCVVLYVKEKDLVRLDSVHISGVSRPLFLYDIGPRFAHGHVQLSRRSITWRWAIPVNGRIWCEVPFLALQLDEFSAIVKKNTAIEDAMLNFSLASEGSLSANILPQIPLQALLRFSAVDENAKNGVKNSPMERLLLDYIPRLNGVLMRNLPPSIYRRLLMLYPHLLRLFLRNRR